MDHICMLYGLLCDLYFCEGDISESVARGTYLEGQGD